MSPRRICRNVCCGDGLPSSFAFARQRSALNRLVSRRLSRCSADIMPAHLRVVARPFSDFRYLACRSLAALVFSYLACANFNLSFIGVSRSVQTSPLAGRGRILVVKQRANIPPLKKFHKLHPVNRKSIPSKGLRFPARGRAFFLQRATRARHRGVRANEGGASPPLPRGI